MDTKKGRIEILSGVPCCGKSTYTQNKYPDFVINRDDVRFNILKEYQGKYVYSDFFVHPSFDVNGEIIPYDEKYGIVTENKKFSVVDELNDKLQKEFELLIKSANKSLEKGGYIIVDLLCATVKERKEVIDWFPKGTTFTSVVFEVKENKNLILELNEKRGIIQEKFIPSSIIENFIDKFEKPTKDEGFSSIIEVDGLNNLKNKIKYKQKL